MSTKEEIQKELHEIAPKLEQFQKNMDIPDGYFDQLQSNVLKLVKKETQPFIWKEYVAIAASIVLLIGSFFIFQKNAETITKEEAYEYVLLADLESHPDLLESLAFQDDQSDDFNIELTEEEALFILSEEDFDLESY